jgi:hypothetical protein
MNAPRILAVSALLLAAAGTLLWTGRSIPPAPPHAEHTASQNPDSPAPRRVTVMPLGTAPSTDGSNDSLERTEAGATTPVIRDGEWSVLVLTPDRRPIPDARVELVEVLTEDAARASRSRTLVLDSVRSGEDGIARFAEPANAERVGIVAAADGWLRAAVAPPTALVDEPSQPLSLVLQPGAQLRGRVVDPLGQPVPNLEILAVTAGQGVNHVCLSSVELRALGRFQDPRNAEFQQSRARTAPDGSVTLEGLPTRTELEIRSDDPAWRIAEPTNVASDASFVTWVAEPAVGVVVRVLDAGARRPVPASATFRVDLDFSDGSRQDVGQWVGKGRGSLRFSFHEELFPGLDELDVVQATFHGTVTTNAGTESWRANPILDPAQGGVVELEVLVSPSALDAPASSTSSPTLPLVLDVLDGDGQPYAGALLVRWSSTTRAGNPRGDVRAQMSSAGIYRAFVPLPGDVAELEVSVEPANASGSLRPWTRSVPATPDRIQSLSVRLPPAGSVVILRPSRWTSAWSVTASLRESPTDPWRGSWTFGSRDDRLELNALLPAEWRFELTQDSPARTDTLTVQIRDGDRTVIGG